MAPEFSADVQAIVGPLLERLGFVLDGIDDSPDEGGRRQHIVFYRSDDCKIQVYESSREGSMSSVHEPKNGSIFPGSQSNLIFPSRS
jgi:hypothetical protein